MLMRFTCLLLVMFFASCAHPLESVMDRQHEADIEASNPQDQSLSYGAGDGLGKSVAHQGLDETAGVGR
jgi:hypothetical protein